MPPLRSILFVTLLAVEYGGFFLFRIARGQQPVTPFQQAFFRAGHAHVGVLVILSIVGLILADAANLSDPSGFFARNGVGVAAILMPAGFFLSASGRDVKAPNRTSSCSISESLPYRSVSCRSASAS